MFKPKAIPLISRSVGIHTQLGRGDRPPGALDDIQNLILNSKTGKLCLRKGFSEDTAANQASLDSITMASVDYFWQLALSSPGADNIKLLAGQDGSGNKYLFQNPYYWGSTSPTTGNMAWNEFRTTTVLSKTSAKTFVLAAGASAVDNYYKGWIICVNAFDYPTTIVSYTGSSRTIVTADEPVDYSGAGTVRLMRHFHDSYTTNGGTDYFTPNYNATTTVLPPCALCTGTSIIFSGGRSSTVGNKPIWAGYIDTTHYLSATAGGRFQGTYASEVEIKTTGIISIGTPAEAASASYELTPGYWSMALVFVTDTGEFSKPVFSSALSMTNAGKCFQATISIARHLLNKRIKYLYVFAAYNASSSAFSDWSQYYFVESLDLTTNCGFTDSLTTLNSVTQYVSAKAHQIDSSEWDNRGADLTDYLGTTAFNSSIVSYSMGCIAAGRIIVGNYYDYYDSATYANCIRFSGFGNSVPQYGLMPDILDYSYSIIDEENPSAITALAWFEGKLFIAKSQGMYCVEILDDPTTWQLDVIAKYAGCDCPKAVTVTPYGVVIARSQEDIYLWLGGGPISLTANWNTTFRSLSGSNPEQWRLWFDRYNKSLRIVCNTGDRTLFYEMFFEIPVEAVNGGKAWAWTKHKVANNILDAAVRPDGNAYILLSDYKIYLWDHTLTADAGADIAPYFDTGDYVPSESMLMRLYGWYMNVEQTGTPANTLDCAIYIDGTSVGTYTGLTKGNTRFNLPAPVTVGQRIQFKFNTNATRATLGTAYTVNEFGIYADMVPYAGDASLKS